MTEGGKNYKLDELIGYYLIYLHYIIIPTNPNLSNSPLPTNKIEKPKFVDIIYIGMNKIKDDFRKMILHNLKSLYNINYIIKNPIGKTYWILELEMGIEPTTY